LIHAKRTWQLLAPIMGACVLGYFLYHTVEGERGWVAQMQLQNQVDAAQSRLDQLRKQHAALDHRVKLMRPESLDPDLLEEESRKTLNYSKPDDIIILSPQNQKTAAPQQ